MMKINDHSTQWDNTLRSTDIDQSITCYNLH